MENQKDQNNDCEHVWLKPSLWYGKTPDGKPTGGITFKCSKCGKTATSQEEIRRLGGSTNWEKQ